MHPNPDRVSLWTLTHCVWHLGHSAAVCQFVFVGLSLTFVVRCHKLPATFSTADVQVKLTVFAVQINSLCDVDVN